MIVTTNDPYCYFPEKEIKSFRKAWEYMQEGGNLEVCPDTSASSLIAKMSHSFGTENFTFTFIRLYDHANPATLTLPFTQDNFRTAWDMIKAWCS